MDADTEKKQLINSLIGTKFKKFEPKEIVQIIRRLREEHKLTIPSLIELTGLSKSTIHNHLNGRYSQTNTQKTHRMIKKGLDLDVLIRHFRVYMPQSHQDRLDIQTLAAVLLDCLKK